MAIAKPTTMDSDQEIARPTTTNSTTLNPNMIKNIEFRNQHDEFQDQLQQDIKKINSSTKAFIPADKTTNFYEVDKPTHDNSMDNLTSTYKKASTNIIRNINNEAKNIATNLLIDDRAECMAERQALITLKDHKDNFENKPTCRLINPAKSEIGHISKEILENITLLSDIKPASTSGKTQPL